MSSVFMRCLRTVLTTTGALLCAAGARAEAPENLIENGSFEDGGRHWRLPKGFQVVSDVAAAGRRSLYIKRSDPSVYRLASQGFSAEPGTVYEAHVRVRTRNIGGRGRGANVCVEWSGKKGYLGGRYQVDRTRSPDSDWITFRTRSDPLPPEAVRVSVTLYLWRGSTGEAWFDDVSVTKVRPAAFRARIVYPPYRGLFLPGFSAQGAVRVEPAPWVRASARAYVLEFVRPDGARRRASPAAPLSFSFPRPKRDGPYTLTVVLKRRGETVLEERLQGEVSGEAPKVYCDEQRRLVVDGKPFFPLGLYTGGIRHDELDLLKDTPFNCLMPYGSSTAPPTRMREYLDAAEEADIKILYSVKDHFPWTGRFPKKMVGPWRPGDEAVEGIVRTFRDHPAVLGWYINDERPPWREPELAARYRQVRALDRDHPAWTVIFQVGSARSYVKTCDILGSDPYGIQKGYTVVSKWTRQTVEVAPERAVIMVPGIFHIRDLRAIRLTSYLALIEGAGGLVYYSLFELRKAERGWDVRWKEMVELAEQLEMLVPGLLADGPAPDDVRLRPEDGHDQLRWRVCGNAEETYVLVANPTTDRELRASLSARGGTARLLHPGTARIEPKGRGAFTVTAPPREAFTVVLSRQ